MKIAALVSGGVDSSVALCLLKDQGHDVTAFYLKIWLNDELSYLGDCPWQDDLYHVQAVCEKLQVPLIIVSLQQEYHDRIVSYTIEQVKQGKTPNPDMLCNQFIKFGLFFEKIDASYEKVATGHYAQLITIDNNYVLRQSPDSVKDQTYFLSRLTQQQLARCLFPIGHLHKSDVRALAHQFAMPNKERKDSQGICFLGKFKFRDFIKHHIGQRTGDLIEYETGKKIGTHEGFWFYTIGQRQGLRLAGGPWYVVAKNMSHNIVYVSRSYYAPEKNRTVLTVHDCHWLSGIVPSRQELRVKLRHGAPFNNALITYNSPTSCHLVLQENDQGIAAGQFVVFYHDNDCLGSGIIA